MARVLLYDILVSLYIINSFMWPNTEVEVMTPCPSPPPLSFMVAWLDKLHNLLE